MNKEVLITIHSVQNIDGQDREGPELITEGTYEFGTDAVRFSYMESELTGLSGTKTAFIVGPEEVTLSRRGSVNANMVFKCGEKQKFHYQTSYGSLKMGLNTHRLESNLNEHGGELEIEYDLRLEQSFLSRNRFIINVKEKELTS